MRGAVVFAGLALATTVGLLGQATTLSALGRLAPLWVLLPISVLAGLNLRVDMRAAPAALPGPPETRRRQLRITAWLAGVVGCVYLVGFLPAATVFLFLFLRLETETGLRSAAITTAATVAFVYSVFGVLGGVAFPGGALF